MHTIQDLLSWAVRRDQSDRQLDLAPQLTYSQIQNIMSKHGLGHRLVELPVSDALTAPWVADRDTDNLDYDLHVKDRLFEALIAARAYGGAFLWPVFISDDDFSKPALPIRNEDPVALHVITAAEATPLTYNYDVASPNFGRPEILTVNFKRDNVNKMVNINSSRLIYIPGIRALPDQTTSNGYDISVLQLYYTALTELDTLTASSARLLEKASFPVLTMPEGPELIAADEGEVISRLEVFTKSINSKGLAVLLGSDTLEFKNSNVQGVDGLLTNGWTKISSIEGIPLTRLTGEAPTGFGLNDEAGKQAYADLENKIKTLAGEALSKLYTMCYGRTKVIFGEKPTSTLDPI